MPEENIDEIIQEILSEEKKVEDEQGEEILEPEELYECPVCHHQVSEDALFCPYCYAVFDEKADYKMLIDTIIKKLKTLIGFATEISLPLSGVNENIREAKKYAAKDDYPSGYSHLQNAYFTVVKGLVDYYQKELEKYELMIGVNPEIRDLYSKAGVYLDEWDIESFIKTFNELKERAAEISKDLKQYLEKLEAVERAVEIASKFDITTEKILNIIDTAKDMAESRKYEGAIKVLNEAFMPVKDDIEKAMTSFLQVVKEEVTRETFSGKSNAKNIIRAVREMKVYHDEGNYLKVLEKMGEIEELMSKEE